METTEDTRSGALASELAGAKTAECCEVCGGPACSFAVDFIDVTPPNGKWREVGPGAVHWFCETHEREARILSADGTHSMGPETTSA